MSEELRTIIRDQEERLKALSKAATMSGLVIGSDQNDLIVKVGGNTVRVTKNGDMRIGDLVYLIEESGQPARVGRHQVIGQIVVVESVLDNGKVICESSGGRTMVLVSRHVKFADIQKGSSVVLDDTGTVITHIIPAQASPFTQEETKVTWADIGGNEVGKRELIEAISILRGGHEIQQAYNLRTPKGILLYGPPGCGKTMLGKAAASEMASDGRGSFLYVKSTEIISPWVGVAEGTIRTLFKSAKTHKEETGISSIIFIDEAEAILPKRGSGRSMDIDKTIVPAFLTEMDGMEESSAFIILATNRHTLLDEAVVRDGRIDRRIEIERPCRESAMDILDIKLKGALIAKDSQPRLIAETAVSNIYAHGSPLFPQVSGALLDSVVDRAKRIAARRDMDDGVKKPRGVHHEDAVKAIRIMEGEYA